MFLRSSFLTFILIATFFCETSWTNEPPKTFSASMLDHEVKGCPEGSECSEFMGKLRNDWIERLKKHKSDKKIKPLNNFISKNGLLIRAWTKGKVDKDENVITWDSRCADHRKPGQIVQEAMIFARSTKPSEMGKFKKETRENIILDQVWFKSKKGKTTSFHIPAREVPVGIKKNNLVFNLSEEDFYFQMTINSKGRIKIVPFQKIKVFPRDRQCDKEFLKEVAASTSYNGIYQSYYCKTLWDSNGVEAGQLLLPWSCN